MISAEGLGYAYGGRPPALEDVGFTLARGALCGVVGANGSGKSTLLALLAGLFTPTAGSVSVGADRSPGGEEFIRRRTALVLQDPDQQVIGATVEEDLLLGVPARDAPRRARASALAERFGLTDPSAPVHTLSLGSRRKLCVATALRDEPEVLLLDEPFAGLDHPGVREVRAILGTNRGAGLTQVVAAHDLEPFADLVDVWLVLERGRLVRSGASADVFPVLRGHGVRPPVAWLAARGLDPWA
jgi:biotin transport system ATP-binding protein